MQKYNNELLKSFYFNTYSGVISGAEITGKLVNEQCKDVVKVYARLNNGKIERCTFQAFGSVALYAIMASICKLAIGKTTLQVKTLTEKDVIREFNEFNKQFFSYVTFGLEALRTAIIAYDKKQDKSQSKSFKEKKLCPAKGVFIKNYISESQNNKDTKTELNIQTFVSENTKENVTLSDTASLKFNDSSNITIKVANTTKTGKKAPRTKNVVAEKSLKNSDKVADTKIEQSTKTSKKVKTKTVNKQLDKIQDNKQEKSIRPKKFSKLEVVNNLDTQEDLNPSVVSVKTTTTVKSKRTKTLKNESMLPNTQLVVSSEPINEKLEVLPEKPKNARRTKAEAQQKSNIIKTKVTEKPKEDQEQQKVADKKVAKPRTKSKTVDIPTEVNVMVLEEPQIESKTVKTATKKSTTVKKTAKNKAVNTINDQRVNNPVIANASEEEYEDEIDSITAKLTDAISQLNFKFDDTDK